MRTPLRKRKTKPRKKDAISATAQRDGVLLLMRHIAFLWGVSWQKFFSPEFVSLAQPRRTLQNPKKVFVRVKFVLLRRDLQPD